MTKEAIYERVVELIQDKQGASFEVSPELSLKDDLGADSVDLMEFVLTLEDEFEIEISDDEIDQLKKVEDIVNYVATQVK